MNATKFPRLSLVLSAALLISLAACGGGGSDVSNTGTGTGPRTDSASSSTPEGLASLPSDFPQVKYHLTARRWHPLNTPRNAYLERVEEVVRCMGNLQNGDGAIVDPVIGSEWQYGTPYFANALGVLMSAGRARDLLPKGVLALNHSSGQMALGNNAIPQWHGNFFVAPMADAMALYAPLVPASQIATWKSRMDAPIEQLIANYENNWRSYAMKGQWYRAQQGLATRADAVAFIEQGWIDTQRSRMTGNAWNLYHDMSSDPDPFAYDAAARANLWSLLAAQYDGPSAAEMGGLIKSGTRSALLLQDPTGQTAAGGRSGGHTWNDVYTGLGFEMMAERALADGDAVLAGQYRHAAMLALRSADRWHSGGGCFYVTKNRFDFALRTHYATYSQLTNYNGNVAYHMAEAWRARRTTIAEAPAPTEIGGYALQLDPGFATAVANAGGMQLQASLRGTRTIEFGQYWNTLGIARFSRVNWDSRLGPSDGARDATTGLGVSYAPTFVENGTWQRLASMPSRYQAEMAISFVHPVLVRARIDYAPMAGQSGPRFSDELVITPDGVLSTLRSSTAGVQFGITWPLLVNDGAPLTNTYSTHIASTSYPGGGDEQNFIALHTAPTLTTNLPTVRGAYGDLRPVRMVSGATAVETFIYPRNPWDPSAENVRRSFRRSGNDFSSLLGRVYGNLYVGRSSAGGVGQGIDLNNDGVDDVRFSAVCGFIMRLSNGQVMMIETDRAVTATVAGRTVAFQPYQPLRLVPASNPVIEAEGGMLAGGATAQACATCSGGQRVGFLGNGGTYNGSLGFIVTVPVAGSYVVTVNYSNDDPATRLATLSTNGAAGVSIRFPWTGSWETPAPIDVTLNLKAGSNSLTFSNSVGKAPSIDSIVMRLP